jgi:hypothetical protein
MNRQRPSTPFPQQTYIRYHPYIQQPPQLSHNLYGSPLGSDVPQMMPEVADRKEATPQQNTLPNVRGVGSEAAEVLLDWINSSTSKSLYPTADEKRLLAARTGITTYQVNANIYKPRFVNLRSEVTTANCYAADSIWLTTTAKWNAFCMHVVTMLGLTFWFRSFYWYFRMKMKHEDHRFNFFSTTKNFEFSIEKKFEN